MQPQRFTREFVSPLAVAEAADRQLMGFMGLRAMNESALLDLLPTESQETAELIAPRNPRHHWIAVEDVAQEETSEAITPASPQEIRTQLLQLDRAYRQLSPRAQEQVAREIYRQARQAENEERTTSLTAMDLALDNWTPADAAAARTRQTRLEAKRQAAVTWSWIETELALLRSNPDGHRLAEAARRAIEAGLAEAFTQASTAVRTALDQRACDIAAGLKAQIAQATDRAMLYEIANAGIFAGTLIGADVLQHLEAALERREAALADQAAQAAERNWAQAELAELLATPDGHRLAEAVRRLAEADLTEAFAADLTEARRALRAQAFSLALNWRPRIRTASETTALELVAQTAQRAGAAIGAETLVMEFIAADLTRQRKTLAKEAARRSRATTPQKAAATSRPLVTTTPAPHPASAPDEADRLLAELREHNPRVTFKNRRARFHALTAAEQAGFVATVLSLQRQIEKCWRKNALVVIRQRGLRVIPASELKPGMRLVGLDWMAKRLERAA